MSIICDRLISRIEMTWSRTDRIESFDWYWLALVLYRYNNSSVNRYSSTQQMLSSLTEASDAVCGRQGLAHRSIPTNDNGLVEGLTPRMRPSRLHNSYMYHCYTQMMTVWQPFQRENLRYSDFLVVAPSLSDGA